MFMREDLIYEIKKIFGAKEFFFIKASKTLYNTNSLLFDAEGRTIAIEFEKEDTYYIYEIEEEFSCYFLTEPMVKLTVNDEETCLEIEDTGLELNKIIVKLPGKAFDCTQELVLLAMENS